ncbi:MAG: hypothetical protein R3266_04845 [Gemmatimonadota bacterium]|nr:hypothetical protein [Gemmatimonadota bacterium]
MKARVKVLLAVAASIAMIAIGQRVSGDDKGDEKDVRTQRVPVQDNDAESWFI